MIPPLFPAMIPSLVPAALWLAVRTRMHSQCWATTTFEVNVTDDDLEKSFIFDNKT